MELAHPEMLAWLWTVPVAGLLLWLGQKRRLRRLEKAAGLVHEGSGAAAWGLRPGRTLLKGLLVTLALAVLALALAQPRWGFQWTDVRHKGADLVIAVDVSSSMLAKDVDPSRLERAKREVLDLLDTLKGDRIGLVAFAGDAFVECPLTEDYGAVRLFLNYLDPELIPLQGTDLGAAIETSLRALDAGGESEAATGKAILLITDGEDLEGHVEAAAQAAKQAGVRLYTVGVGSKEGAPIPDPSGGFKKDAQGNVVITRPDEASLEKLALATGGMFARSTAAKPALVELYERGVSKAIDQGEQRTTRQKVWFDRFQWCLGLALLLLVAEWCLRDVGVPGGAAATGEGKRKKAAVAAVWIGAALGLVALGAATLARADEAKEPARAHAAKGAAAPTESPAKTYNDAVSHFHAGDYDAAADGFAKAAQSDDQQLAERSYYDLGNAEVGRGKLQDAVKAYESALAINPADAEAKDNLDFVKKLIEQQQQEERGKKQSQDKQQSQQQQQNQQDQQGQGQQQQNQQGQGQQDQQQQQQQDQQAGNQSQQQQNQQGQGQQDQKNQQAGNQGQQDQKDQQGKQDQKNQQAGNQGQQDQKDQKDQKDQQAGNQGQQDQKNQDQQKNQQAANGQQDKKDEQRPQGAQGQPSQDQQQPKDADDQKQAGRGQQDQQRQQGQPPGQQTASLGGTGAGQGQPMTPDEAESVLRTVDDNVKKHLFAPKAKGRPQKLEKDW